MNAALSFPALNGEVVTEAHSAICRDRGHATHTVDGTDSPICPRCGESKHLTGPDFGFGIKHGEIVSVNESSGEYRIKWYHLDHAIIYTGIELRYMIRMGLIIAL